MSEQTLRARILDMATDLLPTSPKDDFDYNECRQLLYEAAERLEAVENALDGAGVVVMGPQEWCWMEQEEG